MDKPIEQWEQALSNYQRGTAGIVSCGSAMAVALDRVQEMLASALEEIEEKDDLIADRDCDLADARAIISGLQAEMTVMRTDRESL